MDVTVGGRITVAMPGHLMSGRITRIENGMVYAVLNGQQTESVFLRDEIVIGLENVYDHCE